MINITIPQYDDALAQSLKAQVDLLSGQGEFSGYGTLQDILETYERPLRMSQAQTNTDVFRQTLLGDRVPITRSEQARRDAIARAEQIQRDNQAAADMIATAGQPFSDIVQGPTIPESILERNRAVAQQAAQQAVGQDSQTDTSERRAAKTQIDYGGTVQPDGRVKIGEGEVNQNLKDIQIEFNELKRAGRITDAANFLSQAFGNGAKSNEQLAQDFGIDPNVFENNPNLVRDMLYQAFSKGDTTAIDEFFRENARPAISSIEKTQTVLILS